MIERYTRPEMGALWSDENRFKTWLEVELAVCEVLAERGQVPADDMQAIRDKAAFDVGRILEIEAEVGARRGLVLRAPCRRVDPGSSQDPFDELLAPLRELLVSHVRVLGPNADGIRLVVPSR